jgi:hypothetical protein
MKFLIIISILVGVYINICVCCSTRTINNCIVEEQLLLPVLQDSKYVDCTTESTGRVLTHQACKKETQNVKNRKSLKVIQFKLSLFC